MLASQSSQKPRALGLVRDPCFKIQGGKQLRKKTPDADIWSPRAHVCMYTHSHTYSIHTCACMLMHTQTHNYISKTGEGAGEHRVTVKTAKTTLALSPLCDISTSQRCPVPNTFSGQSLLCQLTWGPRMLKCESPESGPEPEAESSSSHTVSVCPVLQRQTSHSLLAASLALPGISSRVINITFNCPCKDGLRIQSLREPHSGRVPLKTLA